MCWRGKQTNIVDEYSTSRTPEKCTCSHCEESRQDKSSPSLSFFWSFSEFYTEPMWGTGYQGGRQESSINLSVYEYEPKMGLEPTKIK